MISPFEVHNSFKSKKEGFLQVTKTLHRLLIRCKANKNQDISLQEKHRLKVQSKSSKICHIPFLHSYWESSVGPLVRQQPSFLIFSLSELFHTYQISFYLVWVLPWRKIKTHSEQGLVCSNTEIPCLSKKILTVNAVAVLAGSMSVEKLNFFSECSFYILTYPWSPQISIKYSKNGLKHIQKPFFQ